MISVSLKLYFLAIIANYSTAISRSAILLIKISRMLRKMAGFILSTVNKIFMDDYFINVGDVILVCALLLYQLY